MSDQKRTQQSRGEEIANALTHGTGLGLSIAGLVALVWRAAITGDVWRIVSGAVFGTTLVLLYLASTLYHGVTHVGAKKKLRVFDHVAIFLLIAGTYTPIALVTLRGEGGWKLFGVVWAIGAAGILYKLAARGRFKRKWLSVVFYVAMGWMVVLAIGPLVATLPTGGLVYIGAGGLAYTGGVLFYALDHRRFYHTIWHLFVMTGSVLHWVAIYVYVLAPAPG